MKKLAIYYGWPSLVRGSHQACPPTLDTAINNFLQFDLVIFGSGLESPYHIENKKTQQIICALHEHKKEVQGYIHLSLSERYQRFSEEELQLRLTDGEWSIAQHLAHIAGSLEWFRHILTKGSWKDPQPPKNSQETIDLAAYIAELDAGLLAQAALSMDEPIHFKDERGEHTVVRPTVLAQAALHSAEHKVQVVDILRLHGRGDIDLEQLDVWHSPFGG